MSVIVGHVRESLPPGVVGHRCDRSSNLGNPFEMQREEQRDAVCDAFREYFTCVVSLGQNPADAARRIAKGRGLSTANKWRYPSRDAFMKELEGLKGKQRLVLQCWCRKTSARKLVRCHCDTLAASLNGDLEVQVLGGRRKTVEPPQQEAFQPCLF